MTRSLLSVSTALLLAWLGTANAFGQMIRLRSQAAVEPHQDVRLGDIATITGSDTIKAEALANTVILSGVDKPEKIKAESVLMALAAQRGPSVMGTLQVSGAAVCELTFGKPAARPQIPQAASGVTGSNTEALAAMTADGNAPATPDATPVVTAAVISTSPAHPATVAGNQTGTGETLKELILNRVLQDLGAPQKDVDVQIETLNPLIGTPVATGQRWLCQPRARALLGSVQFEAQLVEGTKVLQKLNVQTTIKRRQTVVISTGMLHRGDTVAADQIQVSDVWTDRKVPSLFSSERDVVGLEAQRDVEVGSSLDQRDFKPALLVHKNEILTVLYTAGSLQVEVQGRSMDDGKLHDLVDIRNETTGEHYHATMIAKGLAVAGGMLTDAQEQKLRESRQ